MRVYKMDMFPDENCTKVRKEGKKVGQRGAGSNGDDGEIVHL